MNIIENKDAHLKAENHKVCKKSYYSLLYYSASQAYPLSIKPNIYKIVIYTPTTMTPWMTRCGKRAISISLLRLFPTTPKENRGTLMLL